MRRLFIFLFAVVSWSGTELTSNEDRNGQQWKVLQSNGVHKQLYVAELRGGIFWNVGGICCASPTLCCCVCLIPYGFV